MAEPAYRVIAKAKFQVDFSKVDQPDFVAFCQRFKIDRNKIPLLVVDGHDVAIDPETISDRDLAEEYESRRVFGDWLPRVYRLLAENDCEAAMDELHREFDRFGLTPPVPRARDRRHDHRL